MSYTMLPAEVLVIIPFLFSQNVKKLLTKSNFVSSPMVVKTRQAPFPFTLLA